MHAHSTILGTALLVSAAMAAPVPQITTTVTEPIAGWGGATISNTAINPQAGDFIPPFGGFGYNPYRSWEGKYDGECSVFRRWRGECSLDRPSWNNWGNDWDNNNNWYDRSVNVGQNADSAISSETTITKRDTAEAASTADAAQWSPYGYGSYGSYGGWGYGGARPWGYRSYNPYAYRYNPYSYYGGASSIWGSNPWGSPYYRATDEAAKDATAENANLEAAPAAAAATEATTTVQNSKRDLSKRQWGPAWGPVGSTLYFQWLNWINTLRNGNVGTASFGGINPSFTIDNGVPAYAGSYPGAYAGSYPVPVGFVPVGYAQPNVATGVGAAAVPGLVGTFSVENNSKQ